MATDNNSYFTNAVPSGNLIFDGNIFRLDATPKYPLGFGVQRADGSRYRYSQFGAVTNRGVLVSQDISETSIPDTDNGMIAPASAADTTWGTIGSRKIEITMAGVIANQFAGAYLCTTDDVGEGYTYRIKGNTATGTGGAVSTTYILELYEALVVAIDATTDYSIIGLPWNDLEIATVATDDIVSGVSMRVSAAATPFQFVQTAGICTVLQDVHAPAVGGPVTLSLLIAGAVKAYWSEGSIGITDDEVKAAQPVLGYCCDVGDSTGHSVIMLNLPW